jgi:hypothetical protein
MLVWQVAALPMEEQPDEVIEHLPARVRKAGGAAIGVVALLCGALPAFGVDETAAHTQRSQSKVPNTAALEAKALVDPTRTNSH